MALYNDLDYPVYLFFKGENFCAYNLFCPKISGDICTFRLWAPNALSVSVVGDFNCWDRLINPMVRVNGGIWECRVRNVEQYDNYKYSIEQSKGSIILKSDPYALHTETPPGTASKVYDLEGFNWEDNEWLRTRAEREHEKLPMNIYELNIGSWRRYHDNNPYDYVKLAEELIPYVIDMGYTHIELMPITEYPYEGSWGYQVTGMFAPSSRYGTPKDFMKFVNLCHLNGIGVIIDWVAAHYPKDEHGLYMFDGTCQYEYFEISKREHKEWGTVVYDYSKNEVMSFLISSAEFWINYYHIDGIRMDAVASMIYLDYARKKGEWQPNIEGGNHNLEAISFIKKLNGYIKSNYKGVIMIAEESTAFPLVTAPINQGGLGFDYKWNMGWMNDSLSYLMADDCRRKDIHSKLTFSFHYAYCENYILPLSHDEVVHGKYSLINKPPGDYKDKFMQLSAYMGYMIAHPGKKLLFMGGEFAQFIEWRYHEPLEWFLLDYPMHRAYQEYIKALNRYYLNTPELWQDRKEGFEWIAGDDSSNLVLSFIRISESGGEIIVVLNFSKNDYIGYEIGVKYQGGYKVDFSSRQFFEKFEAETYQTESKTRHNKPYSLSINVPAYSISLLKRIEEE